MTFLCTRGGGLFVCHKGGVRCFFELLTKFSICKNAILLSVVSVTPPPTTGTNSDDPSTSAYTPVPIFGGGKTRVPKSGRGS